MSWKGEKRDSKTIDKMTIQKKKCEKCGRTYNLHSLSQIAGQYLCFHCRNGYKVPNFNKNEKTNLENTQRPKPETM